MHNKPVLAKITILLLTCLLNVAALASTPADVEGAYQTVKNTTDKVLSLAEQAKGYYDKEPERFYAEIRKMLDEVTDFQSFARSVMGRHAGIPAMAKLDAAGKAKLQGQIQQFANVFREGLVKTYAVGIFNFNGQKIEVIRPKANPSDNSGSVNVVQLIYGEAAKPYVVQYKMRAAQNQQWKVRNIIIEGINLGIVYRNQFDTAMVTHKNDIDKVIANWSVTANDEVKVVSNKDNSPDAAAPAEKAM
jgi:phospholipid transport system substrate-binding protein